MNNIAIIYHRADFDGKLSNEVCRFHLQRLHREATIHSYGWDYGMPVPTPHGAADGVDDFSGYDAIYIVDLSVDELMERHDLRSKIVWIDHHKSAIEKWDAKCGSDDPRMANLKGFRIDGVAACRLCWQWFVRGSRVGVTYTRPVSKQDFVDRVVEEPQLIRLAGEYDIWDHRDPDAKALQFGLRALSDEALADLVHEEFHAPATYPDPNPTHRLCDAIAHGHAIKAYCDKQNDDYSRDHSHTIQFEGLTMCALNIGQRGNSDLLRGGLEQEHEAGFAWRHVGGGDKPVMVSLYHVPGHTDLDLSKIAVKYGGGGHRGACGFRVTLGELEDILANVPPTVTNG